MNYENKTTELDSYTQNDYNINLYDVVEEAESYFQNIDKSKKGAK